MSDIVETGTIFDALAKYFADTAEYLSTGATFPTPVDVSALSYNALLTSVFTDSQLGASFSTGAGQESVFTAVAASREIEMAKATKSQLIIGHQSELLSEADFYAQSGAFLSGVQQGNVTGGDR